MDRATKISKKLEKEAPTHEWLISMVVRITITVKTAKGTKMPVKRKGK